MKFILIMDCNNAAFDEKYDGDLHSETGAILFGLANRIKNGHSDCYLTDYNGNRVGRGQFIDDESHNERFCYQNRNRYSDQQEWSQWSECSRKVYNNLVEHIKIFPDNDQVRKLVVC